MIKVAIFKNFLNVLSAKKQTKAGFMEKISTNSSTVQTIENVVIF
jgi:hypothetical protein